jgi:hypothetical protein
VSNRILISAAGTATAFHLAELIKTKFRENFTLYLCDTNPRRLVASAVFADRFFTVVPVADPTFRSIMLQIFRKERIDIYVPLIDKDVFTFPADDPELVALGVRSASPTAKSAGVLRNKRGLMQHLRTKTIAVPRTFALEELVAGDLAAEYFVKPEDGQGSSGATVMPVRRIKELAEEAPQAKMLIQEICQPPELTVEVYNANGRVLAIARERLETKCGVCTKTRLQFDSEITSLAERLCREIELPVAFCFQLMKNAADKWVVTDLNARLGAGTSLSSTAGWSLAEAALITWANLPADPVQSLAEFQGERFVVRAYRDIRTK